VRVQMTKLVCRVSTQSGQFPNTSARVLVWLFSSYVLISALCKEKTATDSQGYARFFWSHGANYARKVTQKSPNYHFWFV